MKQQLKNNEELISKLIALVKGEGLSIAAAARSLDVCVRSAQKFFNQEKKWAQDWWFYNRGLTYSQDLPTSTTKTLHFNTNKCTGDEKPLMGGTDLCPQSRRKQFTGKRYVFTSAQNNTRVHDTFLKSLEVYCEHNNAELVVGTFLYNKNGFQNGPNEETWFDPSIVPYIKDESYKVFEGLVWCGELNILPTAVDPLSGLLSYTKESSGIIPHVKVRLQSIATPKHLPCKMMYTTGTVTKANYIQQKSGQKAEFHHVFGALVAEVNDQGDWFVRQLVADSDTGEFQDLETIYTPSGVRENCNVLAIQYGDLHAENRDTVVYDATFAPGGMLDKLKPSYQFAHDSLDFSKRNHHNIKDTLFRYRLQVEYDGRDLVEDDIKLCAKQFMDMQRDWCQTVVVESNHDLALLKWLKDSNPKEDNVWNAMYYHKCQARVLQAILDKEHNFSIFEWCCMQADTRIKARFLRTDESFVICPDQGGGIECGQHGHNGANGSRGSPKAFTTFCTRINTGHTHSASIIDNVYTAGVKAKLDMGYNIGASSWSHSDIITYPNGKRTIITFKNGQWRA